MATRPLQPHLCLLPTQQLVSSNFVFILDRIYVFGGGQAQKMRFNDTLRLILPNNFSDTRQKIKVELVALTTPSVPVARTYHASCLIGRFMIVCGGEASVLADLWDIWAFDLEASSWTQLSFLN